MATKKKNTPAPEPDSVRHLPQPYFPPGPGDQEPQFICARCGQVLAADEQDAACEQPGM